MIRIHEDDPIGALETILKVIVDTKCPSGGDKTRRAPQKTTVGKTGVLHGDECVVDNKARGTGAASFLHY